MVVTGAAWVVAVAEVPELDCRMVLFAQEFNTPFRTLEIQASYRYDDRDRALGTDTYCLVVDGGGPIYGGVTRWEVTSREVRLQLTPRAAHLLAIPEQVRIPFDLEAGERERLREAMLEMLGTGG